MMLLKWINKIKQIKNIWCTSIKKKKNSSSFNSNKINKILLFYINKGFSKNSGWYKKKKNQLNDKIISESLWNESTGGF